MIKTNERQIFQSWTVNIIQCRATNLSSVPREIPMDASSVYLDGNSLGLLPAEAFLGRSKVTALFLNNSLVTGDTRTLNSVLFSFPK